MERHITLSAVELRTSTSTRLGGAPGTIGNKTKNQIRIIYITLIAEKIVVLVHYFHILAVPLSATAIKIQYIVSMKLL